MEYMSIWGEEDDDKERKSKEIKGEKERNSEKRGIKEEE
jgi:hypothetical protein